MECWPLRSGSVGADEEHEDGKDDLSRKRLERRDGLIRVKAKTTGIGTVVAGVPVVFAPPTRRTGG